MPAALVRRSATDRGGLTSAAGILLAGGASRRFGRDKLREPIDGEPLFWRPLRALRACDEVVIVVAPDAAEPDLPGDMSRARFVRDDAPFGGPLVGCHTGLRSVSDAIAVVVAGDMPGLRPEIVALLRRRLQESGASAVVLSDGERARPLPRSGPPNGCSPRRSAGCGRWWKRSMRSCSARRNGARRTRLGSGVAMST